MKKFFKNMFNRFIWHRISKSNAEHYLININITDKELLKRMYT